MTTAQQRRFYFPAWQETVKANGWHMEHARLQLDPDRLSPEGRAVLNFAAQRAARNHRAPILDDLRHGAHLLALGRDKSSSELTNPELDRVVSLFRLLADPDDMAARLAWDHPEQAQAESLRRYLASLAPEAVLRAIARSTWGTEDWQDRDVSSLKWLLRTVKDRAAHRTVAEPDPF